MPQSKCNVPPFLLLTDIALCVCRTSRRQTLLQQPHSQQQSRCHQCIRAPLRDEAVQLAVHVVHHDPVLEVRCAPILATDPRRFVRVQDEPASDSSPAAPEPAAEPPPPAQQAPRRDEAIRLAQRGVPLSHMERELVTRSLLGTADSVRLFYGLLHGHAFA